MSKSRSFEKTFINIADGGVSARDTSPNRLLIYDLENDEFVENTSPSRIDSTKKTLFLIHGAFAISTNYIKGWQERGADLKKGSFAELLERPGDNSKPSFLKLWVQSGKYEQVIAYDHPTIEKDIKDNCEDLMNHLPPGFCFKKDVDFIAGSRGSLLGKYLANNFSKNSGPNQKIPIGNGAFIACSNGAHILHFYHLADPQDPQMPTDKEYEKAIRILIDSLSLRRKVKRLLKSKLGDFLFEVLNIVKQKGIQTINPDSPALKSIIDGIPASAQQKGTEDAKPTRYLPIIGKYDGSPKDQQLLDSDIEFIGNTAKRQFIAMMKEEGIGRLKIQIALFIVKPKISVCRILRKDIPVLRKIFKGKSSDGVIGRDEQYIMPQGHYAKCYENRSPEELSTTALHSFYLDKPYLNEGMSVKEVIRAYLDDPDSSCNLIPSNLSNLT